METRALTIQPASVEAFGKFGTFVAASEGSPIEAESVSSYREKVGVMDIDGSVSVGVLRAVKRGFDFHEMERHVETPEMLVAVQGDVLVPVAPANHPADAPAAEETEVFHLRQGEALIMNAGVWHWLPFPLQGEAVLLVVFKEGTPDNDFTLYDLQAGKGQHLTLRVTEPGAVSRCGCDK